MWWLKGAFMMLFHPMEMITLVKRKRKEIPFLAIFTPFALCALLRVISVYTVNYTVSAIQPQNANLFLEVGSEVLIVILWAFACYAFMTIVGGESTFKETICLSAFSMTPIIVIRPIMIIISQVLAFSEKGFYDALNMLMWIWVIVLLYVCFKEGNNISFWKSIFFCLIIIIAMFLIVIVLLLAFALDSQIFLFFQELFSEMNFLFR